MVHIEADFISKLKLNLSNANLSDTEEFGTDFRGTKKFSSDKIKSAKSLGCVLYDGKRLEQKEFLLLKVEAFRPECSPPIALATRLRCPWWALSI
jgi:hypothetical protein